MAGARLQLLTEEDVDTIDEATRILLYHTGVDVRSRRARDILQAMGAHTSPGSSRVLISERTISKALDLLPKEVVLGSRDGKRDVRIPDGRSHLTTDGCAVNVRDLESGRRRPSTTDDLAALTRIADALEAVDVEWPMCVAGDVPTEIHNLVEGAASLENTTKNVEAEAVSGSDAEALVAMATEIMGGSEELRRRPVLSSIQCPVSPLILEAGSTDALIVFARAGVPVAPMSMVLLGGSSPVDMASALVTANAENLASLCVSEGAAAGAPVIYSASCGPIDMRSGSFATGSPESAVLDAAAVGLARHYGLPCIVGGFGSDPDDVGFQAGVETMGTGLLPMLAGADLIAGIGGLETDSLVSAEALVLHADIVDYARKVVEGVRVDADTLHLDILSRVGPGGNFLKERHTLMNFRTALWSPRILLREGYVEGATPEGRLRERAKAKAREILATHTVPPLEKDTRKAVWRFAKRPID